MLPRTINIIVFCVVIMVKSYVTATILLYSVLIIVIAVCRLNNSIHAPGDYGNLKNYTHEYIVTFLKLYHTIKVNFFIHYLISTYIHYLSLFLPLLESCTYPVLSNSIEFCFI